MTPAPLIELQQVSRRFAQLGGEVEVLHPLSLRIDYGEQVVITGHSGSGKSTLLHLLGLLDTPSGGEIVFAGQALSRLDAAARAGLRNHHIGFVYQAFHLIPWMSAAENVALPLTYAHTAYPGGAAGMHQAACEMLAAVGLGHRIAANAGTLSGGEKQRVAVARALITRPSVLLADEPTGALDEDTAQALMRLLREMTEPANTALVMVTHDLRLAGRFARRLVMKQGHLLRDGGTEDEA